jgi:hypothetical protein
MAESTLTIAFRELQGEIGLFAGWGRGALVYDDPAWDARKQQAIDSATKKGMRRFYFSAMMPGEPAAHDWSFLRPTAALSLPAGATSIQLPDDFAGIEGSGQIVAGVDEDRPHEIEVVGVGRIRQLSTAAPTETGPPRYVAVVPFKGTSPVAGQRFQLQVYPQADQAYTVDLEYYLLPDYLTGALPFCYGGAVHSGTILEACLAAFERDMDDAMSVHEAHYQTLLAASISYDRNLKPQNMGIMRDRSDRIGTDRHRQNRFAFATFDGVLYP